jgi:hypothetical protein
MSPVAVIIALLPCTAHFMTPFMGGVHAIVSPFIAMAVNGCTPVPLAMRTAIVREGTEGALIASGIFMRTRERRDIYWCAQKKNSLLDGRVCIYIRAWTLRKSWPLRAQKCVEPRGASRVYVMRQA